MPPTARQIGLRMAADGILWPAPAIDARDFAAPGATAYRIGRREVRSCVLLVRDGPSTGTRWATIYARPAYAGYRSVFDEVFPGARMGRDVDHLHPRSVAPRGDYVALGVISEASNRSFADAADANAFAQKVRDMPLSRQHGFASHLTAMERGWAYVTHFVRPLGDVRAALTEVEAA